MFATQANSGRVRFAIPTVIPTVFVCQAQVTVNSDSERSLEDVPISTCR